MKTLLKFALVVLVVLFNLAIAPSSWADRPKLSKNPDYVEVTKALESLQQDIQGDIPADVQREIDELELQKAAMESGITWGQCRNETGKTLAIYGPKDEDSESAYDNELYFLGDGESTPEGFDCDGIYLPSGITVSGTEVGEPLAYKIVDGTQLVATTDPDTSDLLLNVPATKIFGAGDVNWSIPNVSQAFVDSRIPTSLANIELDD